MLYASETTYTPFGINIESVLNFECSHWTLNATSTAEDAGLQLPQLFFNSLLEKPPIFPN